MTSNVVEGSCPLCGAPFVADEKGARFGCLCMTAEFMLQMQPQNEDDDYDDYD